MNFAIMDQIALGEDSTRQFKADITNGESLAAEMAAFANSSGGSIFIGVADDGSVPGLSTKNVQRINQLISNVASQQVRSPLTVRTENIAIDKERIIIVLTVPKGIDKPYFDKNGVIWLKVGSDKRRVNSKEELRRFFQLSDQFHGDELPTKAGIDKLDKLRFRDFLRKYYKKDYPDSPDELLVLLQTLNLVTDSGKLNLAGVLLFAEQPELIVPTFVVKAIRYPGNEIHISQYLDTEDFTGPLQKVFSDTMAFIMRNMHKIQAGRGVNAPGLSEIPETVFEELLVNALIHRDYLVSAPIRLFIYDNRVEIISPGHLPNNLTVDKIRVGNSNLRNPIIVSYIAKGLLPYHGLGSGIARALSAWPRIDFANDQEGCLFTVTVHRKPVSELDIAKLAPKKSRKKSKTSGTTLVTDPEVAVTEPEVAVTKPEVAGTKPKLAVTEPELAVTKPEVAVTEPKLAVTDPNVAVIKPELAVTKPKVAVTKPELAVTKPKVAVTKPKVAVTKPEVAVTKPELAVTKPKVAVTKPELAVTKPKVAVTKPEVAGTKPEVAGTDLKVAVTEPEVAVTKPEVAGTDRNLVGIIKERPDITIPELANLTGITQRSVERIIQKLQKEGVIRRVGPRFGGHWEVLT